MLFNSSAEVHLINNCNSLLAFSPLFNWRFTSLNLKTFRILRNKSQLLDESITLVLFNTSSISSVLVLIVMFSEPWHECRCLFTAVYFSVNARSFDRSSKIRSVLPVQLLLHFWHVNLKTMLGLFCFV